MYVLPLEPPSLDAETSQIIVLQLQSIYPALLVCTYFAKSAGLNLFCPSFEIVSWRIMNPIIKMFNSIFTK